MRAELDRFLGAFAGELHRFTTEQEATMPTVKLLTPREADVMAILWDEGSATVKEAREHDRIEEGAPYTTVLSIFQTLEKKGHVRHEREGRAYRYYPVLARGEAVDSALDFIEDKLLAEGARIEKLHIGG